MMQTAGNDHHEEQKAAVCSPTAKPASQERAPSSEQVEENENDRDDSFVLDKKLWGCDLLTFESLPGVILSRIFGSGLLTPREVCKCLNLSQTIGHWFKDNDESTPVWEWLLREEGLLGNTYHDWERQMRKWESYREELVSSLWHTALPIFEKIKEAKGDQENYKGASLTSLSEEEKIQVVLSEWIANFARRVANSHSWYKHLPVTMGGNKVQFSLNLASGMRKEKNKWIDYVEGDGTSFHYTWTPTEKYRERFGYFGWSLKSQLIDRTHDVDASLLSVDVVGDIDPSNGGEQRRILVPRTSRGPDVEVTSAMHNRSFMFRLYRTALTKTVEESNTELLKGPLPYEWLPYCSQRHSIEGGKLPSQAAFDLELIAGHLLSEGKSGRRSCEIASQILTSAYPELAEYQNPLEVVKKHIIHHSLEPDDLSLEHVDVRHILDNEFTLDQFEQFAETAQKWRELLNMVESIRTLCLGTYGRRVTPPADLVRWKVISAERYF